jgi:predicted nucleic acid-binding protein
MRLYLDAAPVIYTVQKIVPLASLVDAWLSTLGVIRIASDLTRLECRVKPLRMGDTMLLADFDHFFANDLAEVVALTRAVIDKATEIRAVYGFHAADAIHLGAAVTANCDAFLTNDHRLDRFAELAVEIVQP